MRRNPTASLLMLAALLSACSLAPDFTMPQLNTPEAYKEQLAPEAPTEERGRWKQAEDLEAADKGQWWKVYGDETLNRLMEQAATANPTLESAAARIEQSRGLAEANSFSFLPNLDINANAVRSKPSDATLAAFGQGGVKLKPYNLFSANGVLSYEADLFNRVRDSYHAYLFDTEALAADYNNTLLALQADIAGNYFSIRAIDSEMRLMRDTIAIREKAQRIMQRKYDVGASGEQDLTRTMSELAATRAELVALERQRNILENALAVLLGKMPEEFALAPTPLIGVPPELPPGLPSTLLERRPDIAAATAAMQAANARIGVARTAFFPRILLTVSGGSAATELSDLFKWSSRAWALGQTGGAAIAMPIFDSGRNLATLDAAHAAYAESVANYRASVLQAFRDVENNLSEQRLLAVQSQQQDAAAAASARTTEVVQTRYDQGDVDFFEVVNAQRDALATERAAVQVRGLRFLTSVALVRALGGGWDFAASEDMNARMEEAKKTEEEKARPKAKKKGKTSETKPEAAPQPQPEPAPAPVVLAPEAPLPETAMEEPAPSYPSDSRRPSFSTPLN